MNEFKEVAAVIGGLVWIASGVAGVRLWSRKTGERGTLGLVLYGPIMLLAAWIREPDRLSATSPTAGQLLNVAANAALTRELRQRYRRYQVLSAVGMVTALPFFAFVYTHQGQQRFEGALFYSVAVLFLIGCGLVLAAASRWNCPACEQRFHVYDRMPQRCDKCGAVFLHP